MTSETKVPMPEPTDTSATRRLADELKHLVLNAIDGFYVDTDRHEEINSRIDSLAAMASSQPPKERGLMALQALHYWHTEYTGREPSESVFARMAMEALCGPIPDAHALQAEINDLRYLLDTRPAMNAGLAEAYAEWTAKVYIAEHSRATLTNPRAGETA